MEGQSLIAKQNMPVVYTLTTGSKAGFPSGPCPLPPD